VHYSTPIMTNIMRKASRARRVEYNVSPENNVIPVFTSEFLERNGYLSYKSSVLITL
jgi:hypothetical protein